MDRFSKFHEITGYDIKNFFERFISFCNDDYPKIVDYYKGGVMESKPFLNMIELILETETIEPLFTLHSNSLNDISMWDLLDDFTEVQTKLATIRSTGRWMRSSSIGRTNTIQFDKVLNTGENFETVSRDLKDSDPENDWMNITVPQYIEEEQYSFQESPLFSIELKNKGAVAVDTVVGALVNENVLGRDISNNFEFKNDDLVVLSKDECMKQALDNISSCLKGGIPEFPDYGISNEIIGTTVNAIQYPTIFKNIMNMFQRDSRWESVELLNVERKEDSIFLKIQAKTVTSTNYVVNIPI